MITYEQEIPKDANYLSDQSILENENRVWLSPYDVPRAIKLSYDESTKDFQIEFEYLTPNEPRDNKKTRSHVRTHPVQFSTGLLSGKLYSIKASDVSRVQEGFEYIESALEQAQGEYNDNEPKYVVPRLNLSFVRDFLGWLRQRPEILEIETK